jgi:hypothetical protein
MVLLVSGVPGKMGLSMRCASALSRSRQTENDRVRGGSHVKPDPHLEAEVLRGWPGLGESGPQVRASLALLSY